MTNKKKNNKTGYKYERNQDPLIRKLIGQYYTPNFIIKYILKKTVSKADIVNNPYIKVIDPSCGAGYFLLESYDILREKFLMNIENLNKKYRNEVYILEQDGDQKQVVGKDYWKEENIHYHLLKHCIYGADKDVYAVKITTEALKNKELDKKIGELNIVKCDSLVRWENKYNCKKSNKESNEINSNKAINETNKTNSNKIIKKPESNYENLVALNEFWSNKFDFCVGNPPYIGHKMMDKKYKKWLLKEYQEVFKDKSDISFCFFKRIVEILSPDGVCGIITSRYFMESPMGKDLRKYLKENTKLIEILDFYGADIFKGVGVATAIYLFEKYDNKNNMINIFKLKDFNYKFDNVMQLEEIIDSSDFESFQIKQEKLRSDRWLLIPDEVYQIYRKIENKGSIKLGNIVNSFQGIITGCDKAFILTSEEIIERKIEKELIKKWIKNRNIESYNISKSELNLIYSNLITDSKKYPNALAFIEKHSKILENRRECRNGIREWYELQWGRKIDLFQQPKIIFPYKSKINRFAIDYNNLFFSADVYGLIIKDEYKDRISLEYLLGLLNSKVYEFYFKIFAKQMGKGIYDYYPNSLLDLNIIMDNVIVKIEDRVKEIMSFKNNLLNNNIPIKDDIVSLQKEIDILIMDYFKFTRREREIISYKSY